MYSLTNEQKKKIKKELGIMVNDINELLKKSGVKEISININHSKEDRSIISDDDEWVIRFFNGSWRISIEHNKMRLFSDSKSIFCKPDWWLFAKKRNGRFVVERSIEEYCYPIGYSLLLNYETNRKRIIEALDNEVKNGKTVDEELEGKKTPTTQFMNIISTLSIDMFPASTSQAKGRIERLWRTLQDRLITEFRINNITTPEQANDFFKKFIPKYNKQFAIEPEKNESHFSKVPDYINLDLLLSIKLKRVIDNSGSFTIQGTKFQIINNKILPNVKVDIYINKKNGIIVLHNGIQYKVICGIDVPSKYSALTMQQLYRENNAKVVEFANNMLTFDNKVDEPILTSS